MAELVGSEATAAFLKKRITGETGLRLHAAFQMAQLEEMNVDPAALRHRVAVIDGRIEALVEAWEFVTGQKWAERDGETEKP